MKLSQYHPPQQEQQIFELTQQEIENGEFTKTYEAVSKQANDKQ